MMAPVCTGAQTQRRCAVRATPGVLNPLFLQERSFASESQCSWDV